MKIILILFALFICGSCGPRSDEKTESDYLESYIKGFNIYDNTKFVIILPGLGCHGCIQEGEAFMRENDQNDNIQYILTKVSSIKILQQKVGFKISSKKNISIDRNGAYNLPSENIIYPCIIKLKDGKMISHEFQSPKNGSAFAKLNTILSSQ